MRLKPVEAVVVVGAVTCIYTSIGGMKAVLWTDFMQFFVLIGSILTMLGVVLVAFGGRIGEIWRLAAAGGHTRMVDLSLDPRIEVTLWGLLLGMLIINLSAYGSDQVIVQRYLTTGSRKQMVRAIMFGGIVTVPVMLSLYALGIGLCAYYRVNPALAATLQDARNVVPHFVSNVLPPGIRGLVIAGLFAATMSSMSAGFNSLSTATIVDFYLRFRGKRTGSDTDNVLVARLATLGWGIACTVVALHIDRLGNVLQIMGKINGFLSGPLIGMFLLGVLTRRANGFGVLAGALIGAGVTWWYSTTAISWLWYAPIGCSVTLVAGWVLSFMAPALPDARVAPLTLRGPRDRSEARALDTT
jgi:SSS family transporter